MQLLQQQHDKKKSMKQKEVIHRDNNRKTTSYGSYNTYPCKLQDDSKLCHQKRNIQNKDDEIIVVEKEDDGTCKIHCNDQEEILPHVPLDAFIRCVSICKNSIAATTKETEKI
jgi:hypothetical protein